jgi:phosphonate transport system substrate-binding protein
VTGKKAVFFPVQSNAAQIEAMRSGRLHISGFNTGSNPLAVNCAGFRPFTIMASLDGSFGYEMEIITYPGSGIETVEDIKGKDLAFTSETSNSGFKAPSAILKADYGMEAGTDFTPVFSGKHDNSILGVANKDYPAAAIANSVMSRMIERDVIKPDQVKSIYKSQTFPTTGFGVVYNLKPELQDKIKEAFFTFPWEGSSLKKEFEKSNEGQFLEMNYKDFWDVIRKIDTANGVKYTCGKPCPAGAARFAWRLFSRRTRGAMLELQKLTKTYRTGDKALQNVDLTIPKGQVLALIGPSGAGKSTLIRCINRLVEPSSGKVLLDGEDITALSSGACARCAARWE